MKMAKNIRNIFKYPSQAAIKYLPYAVSAIVFLIVLFVSMVSYSHLKNQTIGTYYYFSLNKLEQAKTRGENQNATVKNICLQLSFSNTLKKLFYESPDPIFIYNAQQTIKSYASFVEGCETVGIYDGQKGVFYSSEEISTTDNYAGIPFSQLKADTPYTLKEFYISTNEQLYNIPQEKILYAYTMESTDNLVVVLVDKHRYQMAYSNYHSESNNELYITTNSGRIVYCSDPDFKRYYLPDELKEISNYDGYVIKKINGKKYLAFSVNSQQTDYVYTTLIPYSSLNNNVIVQRNYYFFIVIILILTMLTLIGFLSASKIRDPLNNMLTKLSSYDNYEYNANIEKEKKNLRKYISSEFPEKTISEAAYTSLKAMISESGDSFTLLSFSIDDLENIRLTCSENDLNALLYGVSNICLEVISKYTRALTCYDNMSIMIVAANINFDSEKLEQAAYECIELVKTHLDLCLTAAISSEASFEQLYNSYSDLKRIMNYKFIYGKNTVIPFSKLNDKNVSTAKVQKLLKEISALLNDNEFEAAITKTNSYFENLKLLSVEQAHIYVIKFVVAFTEYAESFKASNNSYFEDVNQIEFSSTVTSAETIDDVRLYISEQLKNIANTFIDNKEFSKHEKIVAQATEEIKKNFSDDSFCANTIAEHFNLSTVYLNRIYKQTTGTTLANVILKTRLSHASDMLLNTSESIKDIANKSGFINDSYFIVVFKKHFGCTPSTYRTNNNN